jgi:hypothetical protein
VKHSICILWQELVTIDYSNIWTTAIKNEDEINILISVNNLFRIEKKSKVKCVQNLNWKLHTITFKYNYADFFLYCFLNDRQLRSDVKCFRFCRFYEETMMSFPVAKIYYQTKKTRTVVFFPSKMLVWTKVTVLNCKCKTKFFFSRIL